MNRFLFIITFLASVSAFAGETTFEKLAKVNTCWREQKDVNPETLPQFGPRTEHDWIRTHLALVETTLRNRTTEHLTSTQRANRLHCLELLHGYMERGAFPVNEHYAYRTPIFIDEHNNFCAVGYLVKETGHEDVSRMIASKTNLAYVKQMHYTELDNWAHENGFTKDELAWIQPGYPPTANAGKIGNGVDGEVRELTTDGDKLYVGGSFAQVDGSIAANNIAWVTESSGTYTWHAMGAGVNGPVNAIAAFDGKIFAGGAFSMAGGTTVYNIAYWDGTGWHTAGCVNGTVYDLAVFNGNLYAAGEFDDCSFLGKNFAKWNGATWDFIPGITGRINAMKVKGTSIALGGAFDYGASTGLNFIWWNEASSFGVTVNSPANEIKSLEILDDTLYAGCRRTDATDTTNLLLKLRTGIWVPGYKYPGQENYFSPSNGGLSLNALLAESASINIAGQFYYAPWIGTSGNNCMNTDESGDWVVVDSAVNALAMFNGKLILGGKFKNGNTAGGGSAVNGITFRIPAGVGVADINSKATDLNIYPQPLHPGQQLRIAAAADYTSFTVCDITGRKVDEGGVHHGNLQPAISVPGIYMLTLSGKDGTRKTSKLAVE
ncbi:MAG: T9SS type A sorting domain-containing protein [Taibaiella sp.]|nr:T9SS type A sorting domain-containing protein [Taibaiella sp.]